MALVPHTITAIERDTADAAATGKQVVVGASCSMFIQPADTVVILYDDANGSNGSTAKTTGTNGQVNVYIEKGEYRLETNGISRFVQVGSADGITTTELIASTKIYQIGDVVYTLGYATAGDSAGAQWKLTAVTGQTASQSPAQLVKALLNDGTGRRWELVRDGNFLELSQLGAFAGDDITLLLQAASSEIGNNPGAILLPYADKDNKCLISGTITIRSNTSVIGKSKNLTWLKSANNFAGNIFRVSSRNNVYFDSFSFDLNGTNNSSGNGINISDSTNIILTNIHTSDTVKNIILIQDSDYVQLHNLTAEGGGYFPDDNRGYELAGVTNLTATNISSKNYEGAGMNLSRCSNCTINGVQFSRDYSSSWTNGFAGVRFSNSTDHVSLTGFIIDGFSRGVTVTTGEGSAGDNRSNNISIGNGIIKNSGYSGLWLVAEPLNQENKTRLISASNINIENSGLDATGGALDTLDIGIQHADEITISGCTVRGNVQIDGSQSVVLNALNVRGNIVESSDELNANKNIITSCRVKGSITTVGANTVAANNIAGA